LEESRNIATAGPKSNLKTIRI